MRLIPPAQPYRGLRNTDAYGSGTFGASRGTRTHGGLDIRAQPGDPAIAPISGRVVKIGIAYHGSDLGSLHIQGTGEYADARVKMLYVETLVPINSTVKQGDVVGQVQDVAGYWADKSPRAGIMKNHVHLELTMRCDPQRLMRLPEVTT
jgi:murein DD-endopeptidase MepM/ murein hydrolase activator NlpD